MKIKVDCSQQMRHTTQTNSYIIENNNGDVVVSESRAVVVTSHEGFHRFSYQLPSTSTPRILACGICTDALWYVTLQSVKYIC